MIKVLYKIKVLFASIVTMITIVSCGLVDFEFDENLQDHYSMRLNKDTVYIMVGDTFSLSPVYTPALSNGDVFWAVSDSVLTMEDNNIVASSVGSTYIKAFSSVQNLKDSCYIKVMPRWECSPYDFQDEMIVNAKVMVNGQLFDPKTMKVAAFVDDECRGVGVLKKYGDKEFVQFRIWGHLYDGDNFESVRFRVYIKDKLLCDYFPLKMVFDGETHGSLEQFKILLYQSDDYSED